MKGHYWGRLVGEPFPKKVGERALLGQIGRGALSQKKLVKGHYWGRLVGGPFPKKVGERALLKQIGRGALSQKSW